MPANTAHVNQSDIAQWSNILGDRSAPEGPMSLPQRIECLRDPNARILSELCSLMKVRTCP